MSQLILKILSDLEPLRGSSNKKRLYSTRSCVNWALYGTRGALKRSFNSRLVMIANKIGTVTATEFRQ
jgi:hypothetical protein